MWLRCWSDSVMSSWVQTLLMIDVSLCTCQMIRFSWGQLSDFCQISEADRSSSWISISQERLKSSCHSFSNLYLSCFIWGFNIEHIVDNKDCYRCKCFHIWLFSDKCLLHHKAENSWDKRSKIHEIITLSLIWSQFWLTQYSNQDGGLCFYLSAMLIVRWPRSQYAFISLFRPFLSLLHK